MHNEIFSIRADLKLETTLNLQKIVVVFWGEIFLAYLADDQANRELARLGEVHQVALISRIANRLTHHRDLVPVPLISTIELLFLST